MVRNLMYLTVAVVMLSGCIAVHETKTLPPDEAPACTHIHEAGPSQVLRHVVLLKFKDDATPADIRKVETAFMALPSKIDAIYDLEWGTDVSVENLSQGFTHCFFVSFLSEADREVYLPHPDHKAFGEVLGPVLDKVLVVDYWTGL